MLPADWQPGDDIIVPAPSSYAPSSAEAEGIRCYDWYFCLKPLTLTDNAKKEQ